MTAAELLSHCLDQGVHLYVEPDADGTPRLRYRVKRGKLPAPARERLTEYAPRLLALLTPAPPAERPAHVTPPPADSEREWWEPLRVKSALLSDTVWFAPHDWPFAPVHKGEMVYRLSETDLYRPLSVEGARALHEDRCALIHAWMLAAPSDWVPAWRGRGQDTENTPVVLADLYRRANVSRATGEVLLGYLLAGGVVLSWNPGGGTVFRLHRPDLDWLREMDAWLRNPEGASAPDAQKSSQSSQDSFNPEED